MITYSVYKLECTEYNEALLFTGEPSAAEKIIHTVDAPNNLHATSPTATGATTEPFLDLTLGVGIGNNRADPEPLSHGGDSSSESEDGCGGFDPLI